VQARGDDIVIAMSAARPSPRPRFELVTSLSPEELMRRVRAFLSGSPTMRGVALVDRIELSMANEELRFWSPQLVVDVSRDETGTHLSARFGPDPYIWGMYFLSYVGLGVLTLLALAFGAAQLILHTTPTGLYAAPIGAALAGLVYGASFVGQGLGSDQMFLLRSTLVELASAEDAQEARDYGGPQG
jgi:hypothetical protein